MPTQNGLTRRNTNEVAEFVEKKISLPEPDVKTEFVRRLSMFAPAEIARVDEKESGALWDAAPTEQKSRLLLRLESYRKQRLAKNPSLKDFNIATCNWQQVLDEVKSAEDYYVKSGEDGVRGAILGFIRGIGAYQETFSVWLDLLPNGDYGSTICGAFKLIFAATGRANKVREFVYETLKKIPESLFNAKRYINIYKDNPYSALEKSTADLYVVILEILCMAVEHFMESRMSKSVKALVMTNSYRQQLLNAIQNMQSILDKLKADAGIMHQELSKKTDETVDKMNRNLKILTDQWDTDRQQVQQIIDLQQEKEELEKELSAHREQIKQFQHAAEQSTNQVSSPTDRNYEETEARLREVTRAQTSLKDPKGRFRSVPQSLKKSDLQNALYLFFLSHPCINPLSGRFSLQEITEVESEPEDSSGEADAEAEPPTRVRRQSTFGIKAKPYDLRRLLKLLSPGPAPLPLPRDLSRTRSIGLAMSDKDRARTSFVAQSRQLRAWLTGSTSRALIINCHSTPDAPLQKQPLSYFTAELYTLYAGVPKTIVLAHFCSLHTDERADPATAAVGLVKNLIFQLLDSAASMPRFAFAFAFMEGDAQKKFRRLVQKSDITALCSLFGNLLTQLPRDVTVMCLIDAIDVYETSRRRMETWQLLAGLVGIAQAGKSIEETRSRRMGPVFKLFVTALGQAQISNKYFQERVEVPTYFDNEVLGPVGEMVARELSPGPG